MKIDLTGRAALVTGASRGIGREIFTAASSFCICSCADFITTEWYAPATLRGIARLAPSSLAFATAFSSAPFSPLSTIWPGALRLATPTSPAPWHAWTHFSRSRPRIETMPDGVRSHASCMYRPRFWSRRTPSSNVSDPA